MRAPIALALGLLWLTLLAQSAHAYPAQVTAATPLLLRVNGKVVNGPTIPKGRNIEVLATSPSGGFVQADFAGKRGWLNAKNIRQLGGGRRVASTNESRASSSNGDLMSLDGGLGLQGNGIGVGFGVAGLFNTPWTTGQWRWEAGPAFYYFPSAGSSADALGTGYSISVYDVMGLVRGMYQLNATMEVGGEVGVVYMKANLPSTVTTALANAGVTQDISDSWLGVTFGGAYSWRFAHDFRLLAGMRFLVADGSTYLLTGGIEYRF